MAQAGFGPPSEILGAKGQDRASWYVRRGNKSPIKLLVRFIVGPTEASRWRLPYDHAITSPKVTAAHDVDIKFHIKKVVL